MDSKTLYRDQIQDQLVFVLEDDQLIRHEVGETVEKLSLMSMVDIETALLERKTFYPFKNDSVSCLTCQVVCTG